MGRAPCCDKEKVKRGPWSPDEDATLKSYLATHGTVGNWIALPQKAGFFSFYLLPILVCVFILFYYFYVFSWIPFFINQFCDLNYMLFLYFVLKKKTWFFFRLKDYQHTWKWKNFCPPSLNFVSVVSCFSCLILSDINFDEMVSLLVKKSNKSDSFSISERPSLLSETYIFQHFFFKLHQGKVKNSLRIIIWSDCSSSVPAC